LVRLFLATGKAISFLLPVAATGCSELIRVETLKNITKTDKLGILLSFQHSNHFRTPDDVDTFFGIGQRVSQLTYSESHFIGDVFFGTA